MYRQIIALFLGLAILPAHGQELRLEFAPHDGSELAVAIEDQFVRGMISQAPDADSSEFSWLRTDADADGYDELFIKLTASEYCTEGGCAIVGFRRNEDESWAPILTTVAESLAKEASGEVHVLLTASGDRTQRWIYGPDTGTMVPAP